MKYHQLRQNFSWTIGEVIEDTIFRSNTICLNKFQIKLYHSGPDLKFVATDGRANFYKKQRVSCKICVEMFG